MNSNSRDLIARLREIRSRKLSISLYSEELARLAGIDDEMQDYTSLADAAAQARSLGRRLEFLEQKVASLEAQK